MTTNVPVYFFVCFFFIFFYFYSKGVAIGIVAMTLKRKVHSRVLLKKTELHEQIIGKKYIDIPI